MDSGTENTSTAPSFTERLRSSLGRELQIWLDRSVPHALARWIAFAVVLLLVCVRILLLQGFYIIAYAYGIFLLHLFIGFLSPARDPDSEEGLVLPTHDADEFKPFVRRLPEFKFWYSSMKASVLSLVATFFSFFDIPVFWPVLLIYFIALVFMTMRRQIKHMIRHKYIPISTGKKKYRGPATSSGSSRPIKGKD